MNVKFYYNKQPFNKVDKGLDKDNPILTVENVRFLTDGTLNITNPVIEFAPTTNISDWSDIVESARYNYFYIPKFARFYYIENIETKASHVIVTGKCDLLMSFKDDILSSTQYIARQENKRSSYLSDSMLPVRSDHKYYMKTFGHNVDKKDCTNILLITTGKGGTTIQPNS